MTRLQFLAMVAAFALAGCAASGGIVPEPPKERSYQRGLASLMTTLENAPP